MPFNKLSPGVYVEEVATGARPIESAATSNLAMIGLCREIINVEAEGVFNLIVQKDGEEAKTIPNLTTRGGRNQRNVADVLTRETDNLVTAEVIGSAGVPAVGAATMLVAAPPAPPAVVAPTNGTP